jgi:hypothetical protein
VLEHFLSPVDAGRAGRTFQRLARHDIGTWVLTGGLAVEIHHELRGCRSCIRILNDVDFVTDSFTCLPESLAADFLFRHIHPFDPPGKTILQAVNVDDALRIDIFRAYGATVRRASGLNLSSASIRLISLEDLVARSARIVLDIAEGVAVERKYARDFLRLVRLLDPAVVETVWQDHRKPDQPETFREANALLQSLIPAHPELLIESEYATSAEEICGRCANTSAFHLADRRVILSLLGYC